MTKVLATQHLLATPPRIVHVIEDFELAEDEVDDFRRARRHYPRPDWTWDGFRWTYLYERFQREFQADALGMAQKLHSDIAYFAHNWRDPLRDARHHRFRVEQEDDQDGTAQPPLLLRQTLLKEHGFTSSRARAPPSPWPPTPSTPPIPAHWLAQQPAVAFELLRSTHLRSEAPIPALLHTCSDSRAALVDAGYELAFGTRSSPGGRTWFHFGRDALYVEPRPFVFEYLHHDAYYDAFGHEGEPPMAAVERGALLAGGWWDVGPFLSRDLRRVRRVVLGHCCNNTGERFLRQLPGAVANLLPLLPDLRELLLEAWTQNIFDAWIYPRRKGAGAKEEGEDSGDKQQPPPRPPPKKARNSRMWLPQRSFAKDREKHHYNRRAEDGRGTQPWRCFRVEEIDALGPMYWKDFFVEGNLVYEAAPYLLRPFVDIRNQRLNSYRYQEQLEFSSSSSSSSPSEPRASASFAYMWPPTGPSIFERRAREIKQTLLSQVQNQNPDRRISIPAVSFVHVGTEAAARWYCDGRHTFWRYFVALQRGFARDKPLLPPLASVGVAEPPPPFRIRWRVPPEDFSEVFREVEASDAATVDAYESQGGKYGSSFALQIWYLAHIMVPEPSRELF